jgi:hypothetical protein
VKLLDLIVYRRLRVRGNCRSAKCGWIGRVNCNQCEGRRQWGSEGKLSWLSGWMIGVMETGSTVVGDEG